MVLLTADKDNLLQKAKEHNSDDIYLIYLLCKLIKKAPKKVLLQNQKLIESYSTEEYKKVFEETKLKFKSDFVFASYARYVIKKLLVNKFPVYCTYINYVIYEFAYNEIPDYSYLEPEKVYLNFHFLQNWLSKQERVKDEIFTETEKDILGLLMKSYTIPEIAKALKYITDEDVANIINKSLLKKFNVNGINELSAGAYLKFPKLLFTSLSFRIRINHFIIVFQVY